MSEPIKIIVFGNPQALKRHRTFRKGNFIGQYDPSAKAKEDFLLKVQQQAPSKPLDCPLRVSWSCYFSRPKSHYRTGKYKGQLKQDAPLWCGSGPDRDNIDKFILDALQGVFWINDSRVCAGELLKLYDEKPRTEITIEILENTMSIKDIKEPLFTES